MAETIHYIASDGTDTNLTVSGTYKLIESKGIYEWLAAPVLDNIPFSINVYRTHTWGPRTITLRLAIIGSSYAAVQANVRELLAIFIPDMEAEATGTLRVMTENGDVYEISVASATPEIEQVMRSGAIIALRFAAPNQYWSYLPTGSTSAVFSGSTAVSMSYYNSGDVSSWPTFVLKGLVKNAKFTYPDSNYILISASTAASTDWTTIYTKPGDLRVDYQSGGSAASCTNWTGYAGASSVFGRLPISACTITLSASTGSASATMTWDNLRTGVG